MEEREIVIVDMEKLSYSIRLKVDHPGATLKERFLTLHYTLHLPPLHLCRQEFGLPCPGDKVYVKYPIGVKEPRIIQLDKKDLENYWSFWKAENSIKLMIGLQPMSSQFNETYQSIATHFSYYKENRNAYKLSDVIVLVERNKKDDIFMKTVPTLISKLLDLWYNPMKCEATHCLASAHYKCVQCKKRYCGPPGCLIYHPCYSLEPDKMD